jgi:dienelactone hydrolase
MTEVVVFHAAYGLRPSILTFAEALRGAGHVVHTPDLYDGEVFTDREDVLRKVQALGFDAILERAVSRTEQLPAKVVYVGFSNGGACAELVAATRPGAIGAILVHAPLMLRDLGWKVWPASVPVQVHFGRRDPIRVQGVVDALGERVRRSGSSFEVFDYDATGHLFTDAGLPAYDEIATRLLTSRVIDFLARV